MTSPRIGITIGQEQRDGRRFDSTPHDYVAAVLEAGGIPLLLPPLPAEMAPGVIGELDGLLLTGGGDVDPSRYAAVRRPETEGVEDERDTSELALIEAARARDLPVLGICRGAQILNVAFGGSLHQHLDPGGTIAHQQGQRRYEQVHHVSLEPESLLARLTGRSELEVNSIHHQGIDRVAAPLTAAGFAEDGVVEVLESADQRVLAVQWHPECLAPGPSRTEIFAWLVAEAEAVAGASPN